MTDPTPATSAAPRRWNALAIVSLVTSLLGLSIVAVIAGHIASAQIRRTGESGGMLAIIGLVVGYLALAATLVLVGLWVYTLSTGNLVLTGKD